MAKTTCLYEEQVQYLHEVINHGHLTPEQKIELLKHLPVPNKACTSTNHPSQSDESKKSESFNSFKARVSDPIIVHTDHPFDARLNGPSKREKRNQTRGSAMFRLPAQSQFDQTESTTTHLIGSRVYASASSGASDAARRPEVNGLHQAQTEDSGWGNGDQGQTSAGWEVQVQQSGNDYDQQW